MNKKGMPVETLIGLVIAAFLVVLLWGLWNKANPSTEKEDTTLSFFNKLIDDIDSLETNKNMTTMISISENFVLIGFNKSLDYVGTGSKVNCGGFDITRINKPLDLKGKGALCLCDKKLLKTSANACIEKGYCSEFNYDMIDSKNKCGIFFLNEGFTGNLFLDKKTDFIDINKI